MTFPAAFNPGVVTADDDYGHEDCSICEEARRLAGEHASPRYAEGWKAGAIAMREAAAKAVEQCIGVDEDQIAATIRALSLPECPE